MANIRRHTTTSSTTTSEPVELDLNFESLKREATSELLGGMREALRVFDGLEALERLLLKRANRVAAELLPPHANNGHNGHNGHTNGNRNSNGARRLIEPAADITDVPATTRTRSKAIGRKTNMAEAGEAIAQFLQSRKSAGATPNDCVAALRHLNIIHSSVKNVSAGMMVGKLLRNMATSGMATVHMPGAGDRTRGIAATYYPSAFAPSSSEPVKTPPKSWAGVETTLRDAVLDVLLRDEHKKNGLEPIQIAHILVAEHYPFAKNAKNTPNLHVSWALKSAMKTHKVKKIGSGRGVRYVVIRPAIKVTR